MGVPARTTYSEDPDVARDKLWEFEETLEEKINKALYLSIILQRSAIEIGAFTRIGVGLFGSVMSSWFYSEEAQEIRIT